MSQAIPPLPGPALLARAYAPKNVRARLRWLLAFDRRLAEIGERAREPMIAQLRLAWWRDALGKPVEQRPKGEPLLAELGDDGVTADAAAGLVNAYEMGLGEDPIIADTARNDAFAAAYASWLGKEASAFSSRQWRPLSILALAAQLERSGGRANGVRLVWHALTGR